MSDTDFKYACEAIKPYFDDFAQKFIDDLREGVFLSDTDGFHQAKAEYGLILKMKQVINDTTYTPEVTDYE